MSTELSETDDAVGRRRPIVYAACMIDWTEATAEAIRHFKSLLRIDTTNPPGNERPAADYVSRVLTEAGIDHQILESEPSRASVVARLRGSGKK